MQGIVDRWNSEEFFRGRGIVMTLGKIGEWVEIEVGNRISGNFEKLAEESQKILSPSYDKKDLNIKRASSTVANDKKSKKID
jgi:uncharacterized protein YkvS